MPTSFKDAWAELEKSPRPTRCRRLLRRDWAGFEDLVSRGSEFFIERMTASLYAGDVFILSGAFDKAWMIDLRKRALEYLKSRPSEFMPIKEGARNYNRKIDVETGKNYSFNLCKHVAYFFPWDDDPLGIWPTVYSRWRVIKKLMGLAETEYEKNTPKDGVIDRIQIVKYPNQIGFLEPHSDPYRHQRLFISGYLSRRGMDYQGGGFYAVGPDDVVVDAENEIETGDIGIGYATVVHGIAPCNTHLEPDWETEAGRWFMGLYSNASDEVAERHTGHAVKL